ncbi:MAG: exodeoxyribonuclease VII small subunit [Clostridiales Family XIII bacterium]|jgi:exodeoxyribonuclease VII small subunit|nr:exodeoxyribonuclease VII small subunit [Clostridiales Family XIII bacterium]
MTKDELREAGKRKGGKTAEKVEAEAAPSFEEALAGLERSVEALKSEGTTLAGVVKSFEEGMAFYERCETVLNEAKQKIEVYGKGEL